MPDLKEIIERRRSVRDFLDEPVPEEDIDEMIRLATWAASATNRQMWKFIVIYNQEIKDRMAEAVIDKIEHLADEYNVTEGVEGRRYFSAFFNRAPAVIVVLHEPYHIARWLKAELDWSDEKKTRLSAQPGLQSIGGAVQILLLAAEAMGYGACWMTAPVIAAPELEEILGVEPPWELAAVIPVGKPAKVPGPKSRKPWEETVKYIK